MTLVHIELVKGVEAVLASTRVKGIFGPGRLLHLNVVSTILHANIGKILTNQGKCLHVPDLGEGCVLSLANQEDNEADYEKGHEAALHNVGLRKNDGIEGLFGNCCLLLDGRVQIRRMCASFN